MHLGTQARARRQTVRCLRLQVLRQPTIYPVRRAAVDIRLVENPTTIASRPWFPNEPPRRTRSQVLRRGCGSPGRSAVSAAFRRTLLDLSLNIRRIISSFAGTLEADCITHTAANRTCDLLSASICSTAATACGKFCTNIPSNSMAFAHCIIRALLATATMMLRSTSESSPASAALSYASAARSTAASSSAFLLPGSA